MQMINGAYMHIKQGIVDLKCNQTWTQIECSSND
jgi:hypothetical protein